MAKTLFAHNGAHVLVDGQFGSTGKGLFASFLAREAAAMGAGFDWVISNAGPNSGHTFYHDGQKIVLKQLPTFAVKTHLLGQTIPVFLSAGAIIDPKQLYKEARDWPGIPIFVSPMAAVIREEDRDTEKQGTIAAVAGTRSGTGAVLARKIMRDQSAVWGTNVWRDVSNDDQPNNIRTMEAKYRLEFAKVFVEVSQGFSLGLNSEFYPKVTSRECTVMQAIADARIAPRFVTRTYMVARTYPIRVGNVDGHSSGDCYEDQEEITWEDLGQTPELTTVTQRVRRVFTFSERQFNEAVMANQPDFVLMNFMNYLRVEQDNANIAKAIRNAQRLAVEPFQMYYGWGPHDDDITPF